MVAKQCTITIGTESGTEKENLSTLFFFAMVSMASGVNHKHEL